MTNIDKIIEYLHYHQGANRRELMDMLNLGVKDTQMKALLSEGIAKGDIRVEGKARATRYFITPKAQILRTVNLDSYYAVETDKREMQTAYNFELIRDILPKVELFTADDYRAALLRFYEQNNISAFKKMFLEQIEFAMKEYF